MSGLDSAGKRVRRPLSPHLQSYDMFQMTSLLSILNRATGVAWTIGLALMVWWLAALAAGPGPFATAASWAGSWLGLLVLFGMTAAAWYHTFAGLRHLMWDAGYGYDIPTTYRTGWITVFATAAFTVLTWVVVAVAWAGRA